MVVVLHLLIFQASQVMYIPFLNFKEKLLISLPLVWSTTNFTFAPFDIFIEVKWIWFDLVVQLKEYSIGQLITDSLFCSENFDSPSDMILYKYNKLTFIYECVHNYTSPLLGQKKLFYYDCYYPIFNYRLLFNTNSKVELK